MSTGVGTLKPARRRSVWPFAVVVTFVMLTVAVIAFSLDRGEPGPAATSKAQAPAVAIASGTAANTPSELRGITSAERLGAGISFVRHVPRRGTDAGAGQTTESIGNNTPSELSGGTSIAEIRAREHVRRP